MAEGRLESTGPDDWAVDGMGNKLTFPDGALISGSAIEERVKSSGMRLTNSEAAEHIIATDGLVDGVTSRLAEIRSQTAPQETV
jgi:hypothetical protein